MIPEAPWPAYLAYLASFRVVRECVPKKTDCAGMTVEVVSFHRHRSLYVMRLHTYALVQRERERENSPETKDVADSTSLDSHNSIIEKAQNGTLNVILIF